MHVNDNNNSNNDSHVKKLDWNLIKGEEIEENYPIFDTKDYVIEVFNISKKDNTSILIAIPKEEELNMIGNSEIKYVGPMEITYSDSLTVNSIDDFLNEYISQYENSYKRICASKYLISDNSFAFYIKYLNETEKRYMEEIILCHNNDKSYFYVKYKLIDKTFSNNFINKVISEFKTQNGITSIIGCENQNSTYKCELKINSMKKKIIFNVDSIKYNFSDSEKLNDYSIGFSFKNGSLVNISMILMNDFNNYSKENNASSSAKASTVNINNKSINKYSVNNNGNDIYMANYIININSKISILLTIVDNNDNLDSIAKDFINFQLVDI